MMIRININPTVFTVLVVNLLATSGDITGTWTSPMYPKLNSTDPSINPLGRLITEDEDSWIGSLINIGAIVGAVPAGYIADKIGRRRLLIGLAVPHIVAYVIYAFAKNIYLFYVGRLINGVSVGAGYAILPMYVAEVTEDSNRASLSTSLNIFWTLGNFIPYAIGPYLGVRTFNLILAAVPLTFLICFALIGTETPHYLVQTGEYAKAEKVLIRLRSCSKEVAEKEVETMKEAFQKHDHVVLLDILKNRGLRKALIVSVVLIVFQQLSGINSIFYYLEPIFASSGSNLSASVSSTICGACTFMFSFLTPFIIERVGKKWLLGISCFGDGVALAIMGTFFYIKEKTSLGTEHISWMPIAGVILYLFFFNLAYGPLPWTISSELFPNNVKAISSSAVAGCSWGASFLVTKFFNLLNDTVGKAGTFWFYSGSCFVAVVFDIIWIPETKGKSLAEIQEMLQK